MEENSEIAQEASAVGSNTRADGQGSGQGLKPSPRRPKAAPQRDGISKERRTLTPARARGRAGLVSRWEPAQLEAFQASEERELERVARVAFASAFAAMAPTLPVIQQNGRIAIGDEVVSTYALWEDINDAIRPVLASNGFALSFRTGQDAEAVIVTAVLTHVGGYSDQTTLRLPPDPGTSRNSVQAVGSSISYGKRYTACALLNITSRGEDDDGRAAGGVITVEQVHELEEGIAEAKISRKRFLRYLKVEALELLPAARFAEARAALTAKAQDGRVAS